MRYKSAEEQENRFVKGIRFRFGCQILCASQSGNSRSYELGYDSMNL